MASPGDLASIFGAIHEDITYTLSVTDVDASLLRVASFRSVEELSTPFKYTIAVATDPESTATLEEALGRDASFTIERDGKLVREVRGIITNVAPDGTFIGKTQARVVFVLESCLANLRYSGGFRIFQDLAIHEIVNQLCAPEQIDCFWSVHPTPQKREYCTQLDESDLAFITRIASEEGMHYFFKHADGKTTLVFSNEPKGYEEIEPDLSIAFHDDQGAITDEHVRSIQRGSGIRVGAFEHRDYNFLEPGKVLVARAETPGKETTGNSHKREWRDYPGRYIAKDGVGKALATQRLDEARSDAITLTGTGYSLRFSAGRTFTLSGHRDERFNRPLLLTRVEMAGAVQGASREAGGFRGSMELTSFVAVPADVVIHPRRIAKPPSRVQSARVVGPKDGDPFVDDRGRVKVQFFWDRDGKFDEKSSCWVRMMTPVAHEDEGFWQAHKVGSEVIVGFIDDDIDRPLIFGAVYNAVQPQPHPLPSEVAKSTWKTKSIPGNKGFNEITFDNTAGKEDLFTHAQRNRTTKVLQNHSETVGANQSSTVGANQSITVGANRTKTIAANETTNVGGVRTETVTKTEGVTVHKGRVHNVLEGDDVLNLPQGSHTVNVSNGSLTHNVKYVDKTEADFVQHHARFEANAVGDQKVYLEQKGATYSMENETIVIKCPSGTVSVKENTVTVDAMAEIVLQCGQSSISLKSDGTITITGKKEVCVSSGGSSLSTTPQKAALNGPNTDVTSKAITTVGGALVKIG
ncbi:type VI secretion system tip protein VgrG [Pendulispora brunnea]|uniref:Type VI secretion system tip protein VgrG n=1 Tax=Pendulispora brunnea TaxID=2905690 RepID=A0ABZ2KKH6_9BACT